MCLRLTFGNCLSQTAFGTHSYCLGENRDENQGHLLDRIIGRVRAAQTAGRGSVNGDRAKERRLIGGPAEWQPREFAIRCPAAAEALAPMYQRPMLNQFFKRATQVNLRTVFNLRISGACCQVATGRSCLAHKSTTRPTSAALDGASRSRLRRTLSSRPVRVWPPLEIAYSSRMYCAGPMPAAHHCASGARRWRVSI